MQHPLHSLTLSVRVAQNEHHSPLLAIASQSVAMHSMAGAFYTVGFSSGIVIHMPLAIVKAN